MRNSSMNNSGIIWKIKYRIKNLISRSNFIEYFFIVIHKFLGGKPWGFGYSVYKYKKISDTIENDLSIFSSKRLLPGYGFGVDERIVEYPWLFSRLKKNDQVLLDAGGTLNHLKVLRLPILLDRQLHILTLYPEGEYNQFSNLIYKYEDLRGTSYRDCFFDAIACISTLEHIGMDNTYLYTPDETKKENDPNAYLAAVSEFKRILKKNGTLYLSVPYGKYVNHKWLQVFDAEMITKVKEAFSPSEVTETYFKYEHKQWNYSNAQDCREGQYFDIHHEKKLRQDYLAASQSVVCLELIK